MATIIQNTQGANSDNNSEQTETDSTKNTKEKHLLKSYVKMRQVARRITTCTSKIIDKLNIYEWWFNLSTKRRAKRRAKHEYTNIIINDTHNTWNDEIADYGLTGLDGEPFHPKPPQIIPGFEEVFDPFSEEVLDNIEPVPAQEDIQSVPAAPTQKPVYRRGGRARELAFAIDLHFGKMAYNTANYEVARRFASRHDLVTGASVRYAHQAALVKKAMHLYFVRTENDLVDHFVMDNSTNLKRTNQMMLAQW